MDKVPSKSIDLINELHKIYKDRLEVDVSIVGTPDYWKYVGVVELLRMLDNKIEKLKDV